jgi:hypothetical protein
MLRSSSLLFFFLPAVPRVSVGFAIEPT